MQRKLYLFLALTLCLLGAFVSASDMTMADFKKMKIKDLRTFLDERGLECNGCQEKSDFVRVAYEYRDKAPLGIAAKREVPDKKFWEAWGANGKVQCEEAVTKRGSDPAAEPFVHVCDTIEKAIDSFFMQHGRQTANRLKKTPHHMLKTSYKHVYYDVGVRLLNKLINYCLASPSIQSKCESLSHVLGVMEGNKEGNFKSWITNVGIENTNPMYEILDDASDL
ncbi:hypothetical protein STCU_03531 [Strigomonas culicis]|nr:hypothetical protein STCU_03531 [Strigomonas culicis]|eukprot:EPY31288.1 hypothetical protein STCU_03531 [Strigomonas culicis]